MGPQEEHNQGQEDGSKASLFDEVVERFNPFSSDEYKRGFDNGLANQPDQD
jgi:hypothetical protein